MSAIVRAARSRLRRFGLVMCVPLTAIGGVLLWRGRPAAPWFIGVAAFFGIAALLFPRLLGPIERVWMEVARVLSVVMTTVILTLTFFSRHHAGRLAGASDR